MSSVAVRRALTGESVVRARGWKRFVRAIHGRAYPRIIGSYREPSWLVYETALPFMGTVAFVYVYRAMDAPEHFIGYVVMAGAATAIWANVVWMMASQLWWEKREGNLDLYMTAPCGLGAILLGMSFGGFIAAILRAAAVVLTGSLIFDVGFSVSNIALFLAVFAVAIIGLYGLGVMLASLFLLWGRSAWHTSNLLMEPIFFITGFYFPIRTIGYWTGIGASIVPLTLALDALRQLMYPDVHPRLLAPGIELAILCVLAVGFGFAGRASLRKMEMVARRAGTISERV